jgi:hypothetical protein
MFAPLHRYLDSAFMENNSEITVTTPEGETLIYRIFEARRTDVWDKAYDFPHYNSDLLILSTCGSGTDKNERLLVYSELITKR